MENDQLCVVHIQFICVIVQLVMVVHCQGAHAQDLVVVVQYQVLVVVVQ